MQSTVIIGLGGTGIDIIAEVRRRLLANPLLAADVDARVRLLWIDIDTRYKVYTETRDFPARDTINIGGFASEPLIRHACTHDPNFQKWWDCAEVTSPPHLRYLDVGSGQFRRYGRLGLYYHFRNASYYIHQALSTAVEDAPDLEGNPPLIVLCTSLCGGTGSGVVIDVAYLLRHFLTNANIRVRIVGVFVLPSIFEHTVLSYSSDESHGRLQANSCAAIKEIIHFAKNEYEFVGSGGHVISFDNIEPFDCYWFIDYEDMRGQVRAKITDYFLFAAGELVNTVSSGTILPAGFPYVAICAPLTTASIRDWSDWEYAYKDYTRKASPHISREFH
jgi:eukaryotic-like serine/threonine-protein kinase